MEICIDIYNLEHSALYGIYSDECFLPPLRELISVQFVMWTCTKSAEKAAIIQQASLREFAVNQTMVEKKSPWTDDARVWQNFRFCMSEWVKEKEGSWGWGGVVCMITGVTPFQWKWAGSMTSLPHLSHSVTFILSSDSVSASLCPRSVSTHLSHPIKNCLTERGMKEKTRSLNFWSRSNSSFFNH